VSDERIANSAPRTGNPDFVAGGAPAIIAHGLVRLMASWRAIVIVPIVTACLAAVVTLIVPVRYESYVSVVPQTQSGTSALGQAAGALGGGGLAAIAQGLIGGGFGSGISLDYFAALAVSRRVYDQVLTSPLPAGVDPSRPEARNLIDVYKINTGSAQEDLERGRKALSKAISVATYAPSGMLTFGIRARTADLALVIGTLWLKALNDANQAVRDQSAEAQVGFIQSQTEASRRRLEAAEDTLRVFYEANRTWQSSPALVFQEGRLHRRVDLAQSVYVGLTQQLEQARITAAQDVPVFSIVDPPNAPALRTFPKRFRIVLLTGFLAGVFVVGVLLFQTYFIPADADARAAAARSVRSALDTTLQDIGATYRRLVRRS